MVLVSVALVYLVSVGSSGDEGGVTSGREERLLPRAAERRFAQRYPQVFVSAEKTGTGNGFSLLSVL
jgi:hypothetical protein